MKSVKKKVFVYYYYIFKFTSGYPMYIVFVIVIFCNVFLKCLFCGSCVRRWYEHVDIYNFL